MSLINKPLFNDPTSTVIFDCNGALLGAHVARDGQWRFPAMGCVPEKVTIATLAFEDRYFYRHPGINPVSLIRAVAMNLKAGKIVSGGSTLTMQTIRLSRKGRARTVPEKLVEMVLATRLEIGRTKEEILDLYLANAPYGGNVVGVEAASWRYFSSGSAHLSWAEAATLAVLPNSPALIHPGKNRSVLLLKRNRLLTRMYDLGLISNTDLTTAMSETIPDKPMAMPSLAPHLLNRVFLGNPGSMITTTLDATLQAQVAHLVEEHHIKLQNNEIHNLAAVVIEVNTGAVLAYVGNCGYLGVKEHAHDVDIITSRRSTGSLLKPLLFAAMLDDGKLLPGALVPDIPVNLNGFSPLNFDGQFGGAVSATQALSRSLNVPAVQLLKQYGVEKFHHLIRSLGMNTVEHTSGHYGLSLILGGAEGTLEEMTNIYASLSRVLKHFGETGLYYSNDYRPAHFELIKTTETVQGSLQPAIFSAASVWFTYQAMIAVNRPEEEAGWQYFGSSRRIAWKTGTSFGYRDGWAIGTSPEYVVGVWAGNADGEGRPGLTGMAAAAPVLFDIFGLLPVTGWFKPPADELITAAVCPSSGFLAGPNCNPVDRIRIPFMGLKSPVCPYHRVVHLSADRRFQVNSDCYPVDSMHHVSWFVLPPIQEWYFKKNHADYRRLPPVRADCSEGSHASMDLVYPRETVKIYIPRDLSGNPSRVVFEAVHSDPEAEIYWHLDNQFITATRIIHQAELLPEPGKHRLILVDDKGEELVRVFEVIAP